ncbi:MAG: potassium channel family protein [Candidatus Accumulibacter sp.]|nr:potassium channel family protein [Accumulibacter sp.]
MNDVLFVILRRLRRPLIALIVAYAVSVWGLVLIPGVDEHGQIVRLGVFHALYFISYTATTIGFGELPYPLTDPQRAWTVVCIYLCVVAWAYTLGSVFQMSQDQTLRDALARRRFARRVTAMQEPFVLIVGYGQSGILLARMLDRMGQRMVLVEIRGERAASIEIEEYQYPPLFLAADGRLPEVLVDAGVTHRKCQAMVALAGGDDSNQSVAICGVVLNPSLRIITRVHTPMAQSNLEPFRNIEPINPFQSFANNIRRDMGSPERLRVVEWLSGLPGGACPEPLNLPKGHWVVAGSGSFSDYFVAAFHGAGMSCTRVEFDSSQQGENAAFRYKGETPRETVMEEIGKAVGIVVCTDSDALNLAMVTRARSLNSGIYVVIRQANAANASLIDASMANLRFIQAEVVSHKVRQLLTSPLLIRFLRHLDEDSGELAQQTAALLEQHVGDKVPFLWGFDCYASYPGLREALAPEVDPPLTIGDILVNPEKPPERIQAVPLLLLRKKQEIPLPAEDTRLLSGDRILFAGQRGERELQRRFLLEPSPLAFVRTGVEPPRSWLFRRWLLRG